MRRDLPRIDPEQLAVEKPIAELLRQLRLHQPPELQSLCVCDEQSATNGATAATLTSQPFGDGGATTVSEPYAEYDFHRFGDMDYNSETSTNHAQFRQYSPAQGRWMSPDPYSGSYDFLSVWVKP
jgi:RHS repeat-associated protein